MSKKKAHGGGRCVIIGAGPAGLTAAHEFSELGGLPVVLEQDSVVGGIARTVEHRGYRFDIGGHRFFSKVPIINEWWTKILGDEFQPRSRLSRIHYNGKFFDYPLRPMNALRGLGLVEAMMIMASYVRARMFPTPEEKSAPAKGNLPSKVIADPFEKMARTRIDLVKLVAHAISAALPGFFRCQLQRSLTSSRRSSCSTAS